MANSTERADMIRQTICSIFEQKTSEQQGEQAMEIAANRCPLCGNATTKERLSEMAYQVNCPICGRYIMTGTYNRYEETLKIDIAPQAELIKVETTIDIGDNNG